MKYSSFVSTFAETEVDAKNTPEGPGLGGFTSSENCSLRDCVISINLSVRVSKNFVEEGQQHPPPSVAAGEEFESE
jgi:hypothetical protein